MLTFYCCRHTLTIDCLLVSSGDCWVVFACLNFDCVLLGANCVYFLVGLLHCGCLLSLLFITTAWVWVGYVCLRWFDSFDCYIITYFGVLLVRLLLVCLWVVFSLLCLFCWGVFLIRFFGCLVLVLFVSFDVVVAS